MGVGRGSQTFRGRDARPWWWGARLTLTLT